MRVETGDAFGQDRADLVQKQAFFKAGRKFASAFTIPAGAFDKIPYFKIELGSVGGYFIHTVLSYGHL